MRKDQLEKNINRIVKAAKSILLDTKSRVTKITVNLGSLPPEQRDATYFAAEEFVLKGTVSTDPRTGDITVTLERE